MVNLKENKECILINESLKTCERFSIVFKASINIYESARVSLYILCNSLALKCSIMLTVVSE